MEDPFEKLKPLTAGQELLAKALKNKKYEIIGVFGPSGTGKSLFSCAYGVSSVLKGEYKRFILARPLVDVKTGKEITSIELGELYYKLVASYLEDLLSSIIDPQIISKLIDERKIIIADSHFLRGRTFDDSIILLDDVQSTYPEVVTEIIMRIGRNSRLIVAGDPIFQRDPLVPLDGAALIREVLLGEERAIVIDLGLSDIVRPGARRGIRLALELKMHKRSLTDVEKSVLETAKLRAPDADIVTILELINEKREHNITSENVPDILVIVKEGSLGRLVGKGGERIRAIEKETGMKIRAVELTLDLSNLITAVHPVGWIRKHVRRADFAGPELQVEVDSEEIGAFLGQGGVYVRFVEKVIEKLLNVKLRVVRTRSKKRG